MPKSKIFLTICLAYIIGTVLGRYLSLEVCGYAAVLLIIGMTLPYSELRVASAIFLLSLVGSVWFKYNQQEYLTEYYGKKLQISGIVTEEPDERADKTFLTLGRVIINSQETKSKILLFVPKFPEYSYGTQLNLSGKLVEPQENQEFSYKNYLANFGIQGLVYNPEITSTYKTKGNVIKYYCLLAKSKFNNALSQVLAEPENSFLNGILTGQKRSIPKGLQEAFNRTGTSHIVAISGFNITIIITAVNKLLTRFGRRWAFILSMLLIILFVIMTGASASVVRAGIMAIIVLLAANIGRIFYMTNALAFAATIMLVQNPMLLSFDLGFQLSFLALIGIVYIQPVFETIFPKAPKFIKNYLFPTIAAQVFTTPLIVYNFNRFSIIAPLTNVMVLPLIPITMFVGFITGLGAILSVELGKILSFASWILLHAIIKAIEWTGSLRLAAVNIGTVPTGLMLLSYAVLTLCLFAFHNQEFFKNQWNKLTKN